MMRTRSEARTDKGWQGFDKMAGFVSLLLAILLLAVSFLRGGVVEAPAPLGEATEPARSEQSASNDADNTGSSTASGPPPAAATDAVAFERIPTYVDTPTTTLTDASPSTEQRKRDASQNASLVVPVLEMRASNGKLSIDGIIGSEQVRKEIVRAALEQFGMRNITDRVAVSAGIGSFSWTADPKDILVLVGPPDQATSVRVDGSQVTLTGEVKDRADKEARGLAAQQLFGSAATVDNRIRVASAQSDSGQSAAATGATGLGGLTDKIDVAASGQAVSAAGSASDDKPVPQGDEAGEPLEDGKTVLEARVPDSVQTAQCARIATGLIVPFRSGRSELTDDGIAALKAVAPCLERRRYIVGGHTDSRGSAIGNLILSQARAQTVVDFLVEQGVPADQLIPKGYGETKPVDTNRTEAGRARNRRIDFRFAN